ncbi:UNVERIFIED_CONTAM: hypothetical protein Scaly_2247900 [Sesamum calycinum]|uniref:Uncharacterized protein n=1 Tax=Sesamum calycinum TaxID=2727403 RepID=A0AAW2MAN7_9LAMI
MDWAKRTVFDAVGPSYFVTSHKGVSDDDTRFCLVDVSPNSYCYDGGPYDYDESGLAYRFSNIAVATDQSLWDGCTQSQLGVVAELMDIKADGHISERIYDRISQLANRILPTNHSLSGDYYSTTKLVKDLILPVENIHACKNGCISYWKEDVDLEYYKFCGDARYKPSHGDTYIGKSPGMLSLSTCR